LPRYDYQCETCGHEFELRQSFSSEPVAECTECGMTSRRLIRAVPVVFKGSGFYVNDYGKGSNGRSRSSSDESSEKNEKKDTSENKKSEAKSDSDSDSGAKAESKKEKVSSS
jgi:putative FmdB family regulatory protein